MLIEREEGVLFWLEGDSSSPAEIFSSIFPADFIEEVRAIILEANPDAYFSNTGSHRTRNTKVNPEVVYHAVACRVWRGRGVSAGATSIAIQNTPTFLQDRCLTVFGKAV